MSNQQKIPFLQAVFLWTCLTCLGCAPSILPTQNEKNIRVITHLQKQQNREEALKRFINGVAYDAKGLYAEAILEYQEALQYDTNAAIYYALSRDYALLNKPSRAAEMAREAIRLEPHNITYRENLASLYIATYQFDLAIAEYERILTLDSTYTAAWYTLAQLYQRQRPLKALELYEYILERDGDQIDILFQCASIYQSLEKYDKALEYYKRMITIDPSNRALKRQVAELFLRINNLDEAATILEQLLETEPNDPEVIATLADVRLQQRQFKKAIDLYNRLLAMNLNDYEIKLRIAVGFFGLAEEDTTVFSKAHQLFKELEQTSQTDWRPLWYLGALAARQRNDSLAQLYFTRVTQLAEWNTDAWWYLATSSFEQGKNGETLELIDRALKATSKDYRFYFLKGLVYQRLEEIDKAIEHLEKARTLNPKDVGVLSSLALLYDNRKEFNKSDSLYEEALRIDPKSHLVLNNYSYSLCERNLQLERCLQMAHEAITAEPNNAAYLDTYGWILYKLGRYEEAVEYIERAIATGSASAVVHEHLGDVYFKLGKQDKALEWWKRALELTPKNEELKKKIERGAL
ncbi:MAG: tetratricopeptide repeat protein [Bacteroidetes bacterium]|nr:tetratricopeptide repeat protein [Bacteroidota bacterium]